MRGVREGKAKDKAAEEGEREKEEEGRAEEEERLAGKGEDEEERLRCEGREDEDDSKRERDEDKDSGDDRGGHREGIDNRGLCNAGGGSEERGEGCFSTKFSPAEEAKVPGFEDKAKDGAEK